MCHSCKECQKLRSSNQKESLEAEELPERPFDVVSADLFYSGGKVFMIFADRLSGFPLVETWAKDPTSTQVIRKLQQWFSLLGKPLKFKSDGGAQFISREMQQFLESNHIQHGQSSPYNPQSNGHAERNVKIVKDLILKTNNDICSKELLDGLIQIRNSPRADGLSPCQVVFGRSIRTLIPTLTEALGTNECVEKARNMKTILDQKQKDLYGRGSKTLNPLKEGMNVWVQNQETKRWDMKARILSQVRKRTYKLQMDDGKITHRNRRWIRRCKTSPMTDEHAKKNNDEAQQTAQNDENVPMIRRSKRIEEKRRSPS